MSSESEDYITEISSQISSNVSKTMKDNFSALNTLALSLGGEDSIQSLRAKMKDLKEYWQYDKLLAIDGNSVAYDELGNVTYLNNDVYLQNVIADRIESMSSSEKIAGVESIIFAVPVDFVVDGKRVLALAATYKLDTFDRILSMTAFDGQAAAHIIKSDGTMVIRSSYKGIFEPGYNLLNSVEMLTEKSQEIDSVRENIKNERGGFLSLDILNGDTGEKVDTYFSYTPVENSIENEDWSLLIFVPVSVVNVKSDLLISFTLVFLSLIILAFLSLVLIILLSVYKNRKHLERIAYVDDVTKGNTIKYFYEIAEDRLKNAKPSTFSLIYINLEKFKLLNEQYGRERCDELLKSLNETIQSELSSEEVVGRLYADNFCVLAKFEDRDQFLAKIAAWEEKYDSLAKDGSVGSISFTIKLGVYIIDDPTLRIDLIIDRARLALNSIDMTKSSNFIFSIYNEKMREQLVREKHLEDVMNSALKNKEFKIYLQPKYLTKNEKIAGAEALVRWSSEKEGFIYPNDFIPLFEKNGFIINLDLYVFEGVCAILSDWKKQGRELFKVSVNCSKVHLKDLNFLEKYIRIAEKYDIERKFIEIEFTESVVFEDLKYFNEIVDKIHEAGFGCSLDDFGSGYSSLGMIQDINVDTIKLDKLFFSNRIDVQFERGKIVVESIIEMMKKLKITTVAEGVEDASHVAVLKELECDLIQGFYYSKPLPLEDFEKLAFDK